MLYQIITLLLDVAVSLLAGACLLRLYMQFERIPMSVRSGNPLGRFIFALTDWIVLPLRKFIPAVSRLDTASLVAAFLLELAQYVILWLLNGAESNFLGVMVLAVFGVCRVMLTGLSGIVLVYAILSWVQGHSPVYDLFDRLASPMLAPIRRILPLLGGVDLSALVLLVLVQIGLIVLGGLQASVLLAVSSL